MSGAGRALVSVSQDSGLTLLKAEVLQPVPSGTAELYDADDAEDELKPSDLATRSFQAFTVMQCPGELLLGNETNYTEYTYMKISIHMNRNTTAFVEYVEAR